MGEGGAKRDRERARPSRGVVVVAQITQMRNDHQAIGALEDFGAVAAPVLGVLRHLRATWIYMHTDAGRRERERGREREEKEPSFRRHELFRYAPDNAGISFAAAAAVRIIYFLDNAHNSHGERRITSL